MYQPIEDYAIVGNMHTAALVSKEGSVDWLCWPRFDSPSVFAALLDDKKGGRFRIAPAADGFRTRQYYWPETNVLMTRFFSADASGDVIDFMPMTAADSGREGVARPLIRLARATRGTLRLRLACQPAFNYARDTHEAVISSGGALFNSPGLTLALSSSVPLQAEGRGVSADFALETGQMAAFRLSSEQGATITPREASEQMEQAVA